MNERIKELILECVDFRLDPDSNAYEAQVCPENLECLVELVVQECSGFVYNYPEKYLTRNQAREICMALEQHFGVEE